MRIEVNAGGLDAVKSISDFSMSLEKLDRRMESMISSFQKVKNETYNLTGGVDTLEDAVNALQRRIQHETGKRADLHDFSDRFSSFLNQTVSTDRKVADLVRQNKEAFYRTHEHLRPVVAVDDDGFHLSDLGKWLGDTAEAIGGIIIDGIVGAYNGIVKIGDEIVAFVSENIKVIIVACATVGCILIGIGLIIISGGAAIPAIPFIIGFAFIGGGVGTAIGAGRSYKETGNIDLIEALKGFGFGSLAGAAVGASVFGGGAILKTAWAGGHKALAFMASEAVKGGGTAMALDFFQQTVTEEGNEGYDVVRTIKKGVKGAVLSVAVGSALKLSGIEAGITEGTKGLLGKYIHKEIPLKLFSKMPGHAIEGGIESLAGRCLDMAMGDAEGEFTVKTLLIDLALEVIVSTPFDFVEIKMSGGGVDAGTVNGNVDTPDADVQQTGMYSGGKKTTQEEIAETVRANIAESQAAREASKFDPNFFETDGIETPEPVNTGAIMEHIADSKAAREASNFGTNELDYTEHKIGSRKIDQYLKAQGVSDEDIKQQISSFKKYSGNGVSVTTDPGDTVTVRRIPAGTEMYLYSTDGKASGIFLTEKRYFDNQTAINKLALPWWNSALTVEKVMILEDTITINGTVGPQLEMAKIADLKGLDKIPRIGGGYQSVVPGGIRGGRVIPTGKKVRLMDSASRLYP